MALARSWHAFGHGQLGPRACDAASLAAGRLRVLTIADWHLAMASAYVYAEHVDHQNNRTTGL